MASAESSDDILKRWDVAAKDFHAFSADLKQTSHVKVVNKTSLHTAAIRLKRTDKGVFGLIRFADDRSIHLKGDVVEDYHPKANQVDRYDLKKWSNAIRDGLMLGFGTSGQEVRKSYTVKDGGAEMIGSTRTTRIELTPKDKKS